MKELKCVEGRVEKWEEDDVEGWQEGREKEILSFLFAPLAAPMVVCVNTHTAIKNYAMKGAKYYCTTNTLS